MDEPLNAILDAGKSPKGGNLGDDAGDDLTRGIALLYRCPGIHLGPLDGEGDLLLFFIDAEHLHFDMLTDMQDFTGMIDATPGQLADMHQSICASQVDKGAKIGKVADDAMADFARLQLVEQLFTATLAPFLDGQPLGKDQAIACPVDLDDFELQFFVFHALQFGRRLLVLPTGSHFFTLEVEYLGNGNKTPDTGHIDNQAPLVVVDNAGFEELTVFILLLGDAPLTLGIGPFE